MDWRDAIDIIWSYPAISISIPADTHVEFDVEIFANYVRLGLWVLLIVSFLLIALAFISAIYAYRKRTRHAPLPRSFWLFIALALATLLVTSGLRFEHKRLQWLVSNGEIDLGLDAVRKDGEVGYEDKNTYDRDTFNAEINARQVEKMGFYERGFAKLWEPPYDAGFNAENVEKPMDRLYELTRRKARNEIRAEKGAMPYFRPREWPTKVLNLWQCLDLLFAPVGHHFWTVQWFAGWTAWLLYLLVESDRRKVPGYLGTAFLCVSGLCSLATAQCLLFALLVLLPIRRTGKVRVPRSWFAIGTVVLQKYCCYGYGVFLSKRRPLPQGEGITEASIQAFLWSMKFASVAVPVYSVSHCSSPQGKYTAKLMRLTQFLTPQTIGSKTIPFARAKRSLSIALYVMAVLSVFAYWDIVCGVWEKTKRRRRQSFFTGTPTHQFFQRRNPMDHLGSPVMEMFGLFGSNQWSNALAFDVLFSAVSLACWSMAANLDSRGMVKCSLCPWWDQIIEKLKLMRYHTLPDALRTGGLRGGATRSGRGYLLTDDDSEVSSEEEPDWIKRPSRRTVQKRAGRARSRSVAKRADPVVLPDAHARARALRSASTRAGSQQPGAAPPRRHRSRSVGLGIELPPREQRTVSQPVERAARGVSAVRRSSRIRERVLSGGPEPASERSLSPARPAFEENAGPAEQAGLTLALFAAGGLGLASAAVFGAEELAG